VASGADDTGGTPAVVAAAMRGASATPGANDITTMVVAYNGEASFAGSAAQAALNALQSAGTLGRYANAFGAATPDELRSSLNLAFSEAIASGIFSTESSITESIFEYVAPEPWTPDGWPEGIPNGTGETMTLVQSINQTLKEEFRRNPDTYIWGQDVAYRDKGGVFNVTKGMQQEFGPRRVFNGPIAEDFILGTSDGFSRLSEDIRVVVEGAEFADYFWPAAEQMVEMSHEYWRTNGKFVPNVTIRIASGGYIGGGLYHSQNIEAWLTTLPGLRVVYPAFADDAAGLLRTSMRSRGLTLFLEPKFLYNNPMARAAVPQEFAVPFGKARARREGSDLTIVAYGTPVHFALEAAAELEKEGKGVEVLDLRSLVPLDLDAISRSVRKTARALVVHEDKVHGGFGGEVVSQIQETVFPFLDAPIGRVGSTFTPVGFNRILERAVLPSTEKVLAVARKVLAY
jgi:2-oxoisovalerate dehydrogenase E1 component